MVYRMATILVVFSGMERISGRRPAMYGITEEDLTSIRVGLKYPKFPAVRVSPGSRAELPSGVMKPTAVATPQAEKEHESV
jgi:hypothetical protein